MLAYENLEFMNKCFIFCEKSLGYKIRDKNFTVTIHTLVTIGMLVSSDMFCFYNILAYDLKTGMKTGSIVSLLLGGTVRSYCVLIYRKEIVSLMNFMKSIYLANNKNPSPENEKILNQYSIYSVHVMFILFILYGLCSAAVVLSPFLIFMLFNEKEPTLPFLLPFIDYDTISGGSITTTYHYGLVFIGLFGLGYSDSLLSNFILGVMTMSKLIANDLNSIGKQLKIPSNQRNNRIIRSQIRNTYMMFSEVQSFISLTNEVYFLMIFTQILFTSLTTALLILIMMTMKWYPAYFFFPACIFQLFLFCGFGTIIGMANDQLAESFLLFEWYLLPIDNQKEFGLMFIFMQQTQTLTVGGSKQLDVNLFVQIMQKVYSFAMLLYNSI